MDPANQITGPNAGGPRSFPIPTPLAARVGQFGRYPTDLPPFPIDASNSTTRV